MGRVGHLEHAARVDGAPGGEAAHLTNHCVQLGCAGYGEAVPDNMMSRADLAAGWA